MAPLAFTLSLTHSDDLGGLEHPETVDGHLFLEVDDAGVVTGAMSGHWRTSRYNYEQAGRLIEVTGAVVGDEIVLDENSLALWPEGWIDFTSLSVTLDDIDGDGATDSAAGTLEGRYSVVTGDVVNTSDITGELSAGADNEPGEVRLAEPEFGGTNQFLPVDRVRVGFSEPLLETAVGPNLEVLADGEVLAGQLVGIPVRGMLTYAWFEPAEFLPFGSVISVQVQSDLLDAAGNAIGAVPVTAPTVDDPGPLNQVPEFESDFSGWIQRGTIESVADYAGIAPTTGAMQARLSENSQLLGYIDVTDPATPFDLNFTLFTEFGEVYADLSGFARVYEAPSEYETVFQASEHLAGQVECMDCDGFGYQLGPIAASVDLTPYEDERVFVQIEVNSLFFIGFERHALLIDNVTTP